MYRKEGGALPDPIVNLSWNYKNPDEPTPEELTKELNGYVVLRRAGSERSHQEAADRRQAGAEFRRAARRRSTAAGCWIYSAPSPRTAT